MGEEKAAVTKEDTWDDKSYEWKLGFIAGVNLVTITLAEALEEIETDILKERDLMVKEKEELDVGSEDETG
jgi:hypothetical protein